MAPEKTFFSLSDVDQMKRIHVPIQLHNTHTNTSYTINTYFLECLLREHRYPTIYFFRMNIRESKNFSTNFSIKVYVWVLYAESKKTLWNFVFRKYGKNRMVLLESVFSVIRVRTQEMNSSGFSPKNRPGFGGKQLELMSWFRSDQTKTDFSFIFFPNNNDHIC